jgi:hypothetical protein
MKSTIRFFIVFFLSFAATFFLAFKLAPDHKCGPPAKVCIANQRILTGAIEMYNMDNQNSLKELKKEDYLNNDGLLLRSGYLKKPLEMPSENCQLLFKLNDKNEPELSCKKHGSISKPIYDPEELSY